MGRKSKHEPLPALAEIQAEFDALQSQLKSALSAIQSGDLFIDDKPTSYALLEALEQARVTYGKFSRAKQAQQAFEALIEACQQAVFLRYNAAYADDLLKKIEAFKRQSESSLKSHVAEDGNRIVKQAYDAAIAAGVPADVAHNVTRDTRQEFERIHQQFSSDDIDG